jgi:hypothetical protein
MYMYTYFMHVFIYLYTYMLSLLFSKIKTTSTMSDADSNEKRNDKNKCNPKSLVESAKDPEVIKENYVVGIYCTTETQRRIFEDHFSKCSKDSIPIEWMIDIADQTNGWFYGTAYHFNDKTNICMLWSPTSRIPPSMAEFFWITVLYI